jgi:hypothetical protein
MLCFSTHRRCNLCPQKFDGAQELGLRRFGHIHLKGNSRDSAQGTGWREILRNLANDFKRSDCGQTKAGGVLNEVRAFLLPTPSEAGIKITRDIIHGSCELHEKNLWNASALPKATVAETGASGVQLLCGRRLMCVSIHEESTG